MIKKAGACIFAGLLTLSVWVGETTTTSAQEGGDQWFIIDEFSGLDLWSEMTKLKKGSAREAKNIQFRKPGTISVLEGLTTSNDLLFMTATNKPVLGLGSIQNFTNDSDRVILACSSVFFNSYGSALTSIFQSTATESGKWHTASSDSFWLDTGAVDIGRAAEFWRAGWIAGFTIAGPAADYETIDYIIDNNSLWFTDTVAENETSDPGVYPQLPSATANVQFVNVDVHGTAMVVCLQAGMEPVLYDGNSVKSMRYFGVADSGIVKKVGYGIDSTIFTVDVVNSANSGASATLTQADDYWNNATFTVIDISSVNTDSTRTVVDFNAAGDSLEWTTAFATALTVGDTVVLTTAGADMYIVDNTKLGIYADKFLGPDTAGYWLHLPYRFPDGDSSTFGRMFPIDSNIVTIVDDTLVEFRIYFRPGADSANGIYTTDRGEFIDSITGSHYQIISAPFLRDEVTEADSPDAVFHNGGEVVSIDTASATTAGIGQHEYDQRAFVLFFDGAYADTVLVGVTNPLGGLEGVYEIQNRSISTGFPIRATYNGGTPHAGSLVVVMGGPIENRGLADLTSSAWSIFNITIPFASHGISYRERLFLAGDPQDPNFVVFSEPFEVGAFPVNNVFSIGANGDKFVGFALIYDWLVIFQEKHTWVLKGDPSITAPELVLPSEGCIAIESIVAEGNKIVYLSDRGWREFDGNNARDFALAIKPGVQAFPRVVYSVNQGARSKSAAAFDQSTGTLWMSQPFGSATTNSGSWLHNSVDGSFTYSDEIYGGIIRSIDFDDTTRLFFTHPDSSIFYLYGYNDSAAVEGLDGDSMNVVWSTGWFDFGHPEQNKFLQDGFLHFLASTATSSSGNTGFTVNMFKDFDTTAFFTESASPVGYISSVFFWQHFSLHLEPHTDLQWLRIELTGDGLNVMDIRRLALRYSLGTDLVRDAAVIIRAD